MNNKRGISLIVLVITIIVMIILAAAIILSLSGNGIIFKTNKAKFQNDMSTMKEELSVYISNKEVETNGAYNHELLNADKSSLVEEGTTVEGKTILDVIKSMDKKYLDEIEVVSGRLRYTGSNIDEIKWSDEILEGIRGYELAEVNIEEANTLKLSDGVNTTLASYRIYGNSIQDETTSIESVGSKKSKVIYIPELNETIYSGWYAIYGSTGGYKTDIILEPNTTYYVSFDYVINSATEVLGTGIGYGDTDYKKDIRSLIVWDSQEKNKKATMSFSFTTPEILMPQYGTPYLWIRFSRINTRSSYNVDLSNIYVSENPYNSTECYNIQYTVKGINLFSMAKCNPVNTTVNGITFTTLDDERIHIKGKLEDTSKSASVYITPITIANISIKQGNYYSKKPSINNLSILFGVNNSSSNTNINSNYNPGNIDFDDGYLTNVFIYIGANDTRQWDDIIELQLTKGTINYSYEPYAEPKTYNIYIDEPLRKIGDYVDYIDFRSQEVVRNVEVIDDTGTLPLEQSLRGLDTPVREKISIPNVMLNEGTNIIEVLTKVQPSRIETLYYKK